MAFEPGLKQRLALGRETALKRALEANTQAAYYATWDAFTSLCIAQGVPIAFRWQQLAAWCVFWCENGYKGRTLKNHFTHFRSVATELNLKYPASKSRTARRIARLVRGLKKDHDGEVRRATPLTRRWLRLIFRACGVHSLRDLWRVQPSVATFVVRVAVAHDCCLRMCEHHDGLRVGMCETVSLRGAETVLLHLPEVKDKMRHNRICEMPVFGGLDSAGAMLQIYIARFHDGQPASSTLFPDWSDGDDQRRLPSTAPAGRFTRALRVAALAAGMRVDMVARVTPHSLRAGGCTSWLSGGAEEAWVQRQGGWRSSIYKLYYRPSAADMALMHEKLAAAACAAGG